ncbi:MAG: hypothetical protein AB7Y46_19680 [Armatimonadota bacterium]
MAPTRAQGRAGRRVLTGLARVVAAVVVALVASAALAELPIQPIEFDRVLPVLVMGEAIAYVLVLGGGVIPGPIMLTAIVLAFVLRAGIALGAAFLSPRAAGDLLAGGRFYYASFWPAAAAQVLLMALLLRLIRPLMAKRRRPTRRVRARRAPEPPLDDESRKAILAALEQPPDQPPQSPTMLEELQLGDLAELSPPEVEQPQAPAQELVLPFEEAEEAASAEGIASAEEEPEPAREPEPAQPVAAELAPGEETERLEPVVAGVPVSASERAAAEPVADVRPDEGPPSLQAMVAAIAEVVGEGAEVRVWGTAEGRTVLAAVPAGTPITGTAGRAEALVAAHRELCAWLAADPTSVQLAATCLGACALRALDDGGELMLLLAGQGRAAAGRLELAMARAAGAVQGMVPAATGGTGAPRPAAMAPLRVDRALTARIADAASLVAGRLVRWAGYRGPDGRAIAACVPPGSEAEPLARIAASAADALAGFADAAALGAPAWLSLSGGGAVLMLAWRQIAGEAALLVAASPHSAAVGRMRWELEQIARRAAESP